MIWRSGNGSPIPPPLTSPLAERVRWGLLAREPQTSIGNLRKLDCFRQNWCPPRIKSGAGFLLIARLRKRPAALLVATSCDAVENPTSAAEFFGKNRVINGFWRRQGFAAKTDFRLAHAPTQPECWACRTASRTRSAESRSGAFLRRRRFLGSNLRGGRQLGITSSAG